jgi:hypothetical protein
VAAIRAFLATIAALVGLPVTIPLVLLALPFWVVASLTRALCRPFESQAVSWQDVIEFDPIIGWKPRKGLDTFCSFEAGTFHVRTDPQGWPGKSSIAESQIVVFGDSFAFGYGVNAEAMFSELNPKLHIKSIGAPGYNMAQELMLMRQFSSQLQGKLVVWFIYMGNDLWENLQPNMHSYRTPFVREVKGTAGWEIVTTHISPTKWHYHFADTLRAAERFAGVFSGTTFLSQRMYSACEFMISQGRDVCHQVGARLVVMTIPVALQVSRSDWERSMADRPDAKLLDPDLPDQKMREICSKLGVHFIAAKDFLSTRDYIPVEGHWNERGHQRVATALWNLCQVPSTSPSISG